MPSPSLVQLHIRIRGNETETKVEARIDQRSWIQISRFSLEHEDCYLTIDLLTAKIRAETR